MKCLGRGCVELFLCVGICMGMTYIACRYATGGPTNKYEITSKPSKIFIIRCDISTEQKK